MPDTPDSLMLFAAGLGTRMGALTADRPKPLVEVAGHALIDHALALVDEVRPRRVVVNTHYLSDQIGRHLAHRPDIALSHEPELLDTGGGLKAALPLLEIGPVYTLNSDAIWAGPNPLAALRAAWDPKRMDALVLLIAPDRALGHVGKGDFLLEPGGRIRRGPGAIYSGAQIIRPAAFADWPEEVFSVNRVWDELIAAGRAYGLVYDGRWCDVGRPEGIALAEGLLAEGPAGV